MALIAGYVIFLTNPNNKRVAKLITAFGEIALRWTIVPALFLIGALGACGHGYVAMAPPVSDAAYRLGGGDKIKLTVFGDTSITGTYSVDGEGTVSLPGIGDMHAKGMTIGEFRSAVEDQLKKLFRNPRVAAEVENFRTVYILGDVTTPGEFPYAPGMSVYALTAKAGGFTYRANRHLVYIRHDGEAAEHRYLLTSGTGVAPGDTVRIAQRIF